MNFYLGDLNLPREIPFKVCYSHNWQADGSFRLWVTSILSSKAMSFFMGPFRFLQNSLTDSKKSTRLLNQFLKLSLRGGWNCGLVDSKSWLAHSKPLVQTPAVHKPGMVVYICNFNTWEIEAGGYAPQDHLWLHRVWSHAGLNENLLFLKKKKTVNLQNFRKYSLLSSHFIDQTSVFIHSKIQEGGFYLPTRGASINTWLFLFFHTELLMECIQPIKHGLLPVSCMSLLKYPLLPTDFIKKIKYHLTSVMYHLLIFLLYVLLPLETSIHYPFCYCDTSLRWNPFLFSGAPVCTIYTRYSTHTCNHVHIWMNFCEDAWTYWSFVSMLC